MSDDNRPPYSVYKLRPGELTGGLYRDEVLAFIRTREVDGQGRLTQDAIRSILHHLTGHDDDMIDAFLGADEEG